MPTAANISPPTDTSVNVSSDFMSPNFADYKYAQPRLKKIVDDWSTIAKETERFRKLRYIRVDTDSLQQDGHLKADETYVATRLIDANIRAEQPQRVAYFTQSRRAAVFVTRGGKKVNGVENLESLFTDVSRYVAWETPFLRVDDGCMTHGWDNVEVVFDINYPGHFVIEHVGHENLLFDTDAEELENQEIVLRKCKMSSIQLRINVKKYGFSEAEVRKLIEKNNKSEHQTKDVLFDIYKCFYRNDEDSIIYVGWFHPDLDEWIKEPEPLFMGIRDIKVGQIEAQPDGTMDFPKIFETEYPFYKLRYVESENERITETKGRGYLDEPSQSSASAILSSIVNGTNRASKSYACVAANPANPNSSIPKETSIVVKPNVLYDQPLEFFHQEYPPVSAIQAFNLVTTANKAETAKVDIATNNRQDSRKTATEVAKADKDASALSGVQVIMLSIFFRQVYTRCWRIYQARVLQGNIKVAEELMSLFQEDYDVKSAGDVDVIKRAEKIQRQQTAWPVIQKTPIANIFLTDIIRNLFPEEADKYIAQLNAQDPRQLVTQLATILQTVLVDPRTGKLVPDAIPYAHQLQVLQQQVNSYLASTASAEQASAPAQQAQEAAKNIEIPLNGQQEGETAPNEEEQLQQQAQGQLQPAQ